MSLVTTFTRRVPPAQACAWVAVVVGATTLLGWTLDVERLKSVVPGFVAMNPLTAVLFAASGVALALLASGGATRRQKLAAHLLGVAVAWLGGARLLGYVVGYRSSVDLVLFSGSLGDNCMAPNTAGCFVLTGLSLASLDWVTSRGRWPAQWLALATALLALVSLMGYGYGATSLYQVRNYIPMALNTAVVFGALAIGLLLSRPGRGVASVAFHSGPGGVMARRLLPLVLCFSFVLGSLRLLVEDFGVVDDQLGAAISTSLMVLVFGGTTFGIAAALNRTDDQRRRALAQLEAKNRETRDLYDRAPCGYLSVDADGSIVEINETALGWLGMTRTDVVGRRSLADVVHPAHRAAVNFQLAAMKGGTAIADLEIELVDSDGGAMPVLHTATAIRSDAGEFLASRSSLFDARERRRIEESRRQMNAELERRVAARTEELAAANAELSVKNEENELFVYSVSHDLRSPLVNLQGFSNEVATIGRELSDALATSADLSEVRRRVEPLLNDDLPQAIHFIQSAVMRLSGIIDALLRLSRAGRVEYRMEDLDLDAIVSRILEATAGTIYERGATISVEALGHAWGDAVAVEQVFANLIGNALNYLDPSRPGAIGIGLVDDAVTGDHAEGGSTAYFIRDNGLGIPEAYHGKVFQALKRFHPDAAKGEGIGLAIVRRMVERHGGSIRFESEANQGTTMFVTLPRSQETARGIVREDARQENQHV